MDADEARRRFAAARVARFATVDPEGRPHIVPIVFAVDGDRIYSIVDAKPKSSPRLKRIANMERNPRVSAIVDHYDEDWDTIWWARADGTAQVVDDGPLRARAIDALYAKYPQYGEWSTPIGAAIVVTVDRWVGWSLA